jgi:hypothetical protein
MVVGVPTVKSARTRTNRARSRDDYDDDNDNDDLDDEHGRWDGLLGNGER